MNVTSTSYSGYVTGSTCVCNNLYNEFISSLDDVKNKTMLMSHSSEDLELARKYYSNYLTEEELQEKQYSGRFWHIEGVALYILFDNETVIAIHYNNIKIFERGSYKLPVRLQGRYYDEY